MLASGVDIIEIERVETSLNRFGSQFLNRLFTPQEQAQCAGKTASLAGRYAVKEAVSKALGTGIGAIKWTDIEIIANDQGKPMLVLHDNAKLLAAQSGLQEWSISISHTNTLAIGFAIALGSFKPTETTMQESIA